MFVVKGETSRSHEIDEKRLHELGSSDRSVKQTSVLSMLTMEQGNLWSKAAQAHTQ